MARSILLAALIVLSAEADNGNPSPDPIQGWEHIGCVQLSRKEFTFGYPLAADQNSCLKSCDYYESNYAAIGEWCWCGKENITQVTVTKAPESNCEKFCYPDAPDTGSCGDFVDNIQHYDLFKKSDPAVAIVELPATPSAPTPSSPTPSSPTPSSPSPSSSTTSSSPTCPPGGCVAQTITSSILSTATSFTDTVYQGSGSKTTVPNGSTEIVITDPGSGSTITVPNGSGETVVVGPGSGSMTIVPTGSVSTLPESSNAHSGHKPHAAIVITVSAFAVLASYLA
ncbi:hypothetical protein EDB80DRAFT_877171 [Ilyonectria destructans]|nr:hypothetical protein EDB80DRAFT_877171 [Ilyonectria destructans]